MCESEAKDAIDFEEVSNIPDAGESMTGSHIASGQPSNRRQRLDAIAKDFLGKEETENVVVSLPMYYGDLLSWALRYFLENSGWHVNNIFGYHEQRPVYSDALVGYELRQSLLRDGIVFIEKDDGRLVITVNGLLNYVLITGSSDCKELADEVAHWIRIIAKTCNFYRGGKIELMRGIYFIEPPAKTWENLILDPGVKEEIWGNTIGFLEKRHLLRKFGVPAKRGVLLVGEPGTGKTLLCKGIMSAAKEFTFIKANQKYLDDPRYIVNLYKVALDLSPSIVFIEDIDRIASGRMEFRGLATITTLLDILDGLEELNEVVTVATTNSLETIDKAFTSRPSRFDRVIELPLPNRELREELIAQACNKLALSDDNRAYIAGKTENCTPAQIQEIIYTLAIDYCHNEEASRAGCPSFSQVKLSEAIAKVVRKDGRRMGFIMTDNGNRMDKTRTARIHEVDMN